MDENFEIIPTKKSRLINFRVTDEEHKALRAYCDKHNVSISVFIRHVLNKIIK